MLCVKCNADNKLKDRQRTHGRCTRCGHQFAFDPKITSGVNFTDKFFQQTIEQLSVNSSLYFTDRQLYYFFNHRQNKKRDESVKRYAGCSIPIAIVLGIIFAIATGVTAAWLVPVVVIVPFAIAAIFGERFRQWLSGNQTQQLRTPPSQVAAWYARWTRLNKAPEKLLAPVNRSKPKQLTGVNPELKNYSFDRAVICERDEIAQFLIANKFHFENNAAVLSINGYPDDIFDTVMEMLRRNPTLSVYAVHDASVQGVEMISKLRKDQRWFAGKEVKIYDLGLLPRQIMKRSVFVEKSNDLRVVTVEAAATLQPDEITWLNRGNYVSLESFSPRVLLRVITNGIGKSRDPKAADALVPFETDGVFFYYYSYDTFG